MSAVVMATDAQLCHISWIFPLLCVHTHPYTLTHVSSAYKREIPLFVSFICFFFHVACCSSCLCCCGYRRLRAILVNLNCYFTLKALQKRFTVTLLPSHAPLPLSLSPFLLWFGFSVIFMLITSHLLLALASLCACFQFTITTTKTMAMSRSIVVVVVVLCELILISIRLLLFVVGLVFTVCSRLVAYLLHFVL